MPGTGLKVWLVGTFITLHLLYYATLHYFTLHSLYYITLHYITLITLHYVHYNTSLCYAASITETLMENMKKLFCL